MNEYRRPTIPVEIYRDELGTPIDYGNRWGGACAPEDAYSRVSNLQRFAPLHAVAMALIEWLQDTFDVTLAEELEWTVRTVVSGPRTTSASVVLSRTSVKS